MLSSKLLLFAHFSQICNLLTVEGEKQHVIIFVFYFSVLESTNFIILPLPFRCTGIMQTVW